MYLTKRQKEILDFVTHFITTTGYSPSFVEIGKNAGLSSVATVHRHIANLEKKGLLKKGWNRSRSLELASIEPKIGAIEVPLFGLIAAGKPIEAISSPETMAIPEDMLGKKPTYVLQVKGDSMIEEQIRDGDFVIVESSDTAQNGETVVALLNNGEATLKKYFRENGQIRLQPANPSMSPIFVHEDELRIQGVVIGIIRKFR